MWQYVEYVKPSTKVDLTRNNLSLGSITQKSTWIDPGRVQSVNCKADPTDHNWIEHNIFGYIF